MIDSMISRFDIDSGKSYNIIEFWRSMEAQSALQHMDFPNDGLHRISTFDVKSKDPGLCHGLNILLCFPFNATVSGKTIGSYTPWGAQPG